MKTSKMVPHMIHTPPKMWANVGKHSRRLRITMSAYVREAIEEKLAKERRLYGDPGPKS